VGNNFSGLFPPPRVNNLTVPMKIHGTSVILPNLFYINHEHENNTTETETTDLLNCYLVNKHS
jgi:hypothetical protein